MPSVLDPNSPQMRALMMRSPGLFSSLAKKMQATNSQPDANLIAGSNNAGGVMPNMTPNTNSNVGGRSTFGGTNSNMNSLATMFRSPIAGQNTFNISGTNDGSNNSTFGTSIPSFAAGGMVAPQGGAIRPGAGMQPEMQLGAQPGAELTGPQLEQEAQSFIQQHPEEAQKVQAAVALAIQTGELTAQELNMAVQLAKAALANPAAYPQIRQFAIKNGLGTEAEVPQQIDKGLLYALLLTGMSSQAAAPQGNAMQGQGPAPTMEGGMMPSYKEGGMTGDKPHIAKLHAREYVVPEDALIYHGKKHFDKLVEQARTPPDASNQK